MGRALTALVALLFAGAFAPAVVRGDTVDSPQAAAAQLPCAFDFQATSATATPNATTLHLRGGRPLRGTGCSTIAAVRPHARYDAADPMLAVDAQDAGPTGPLTCTRPFEAARVVHAVEPDAPVMAMQQGITGLVGVAVALDATGRVVAAAIQRSPSAILNSASISAARRSTYQPAVVACHQVPSAYEFVVSFSQL